MEATSSRLGKGALALPFPWTPPIDQGAFEPLGTLINPARIGYHQRVDAETGQGAIVPLKPLLLSALEHVPAEVDFNVLGGIVTLNQNRPGRVIRAERRQHFESRRKLGVDLHRFISFKVFYEPVFDTSRIVDNMLIGQFLRLQRVLLGSPLAPPAWAALAHNGGHHLSVCSRCRLPERAT